MSLKLKKLLCTAVAMITTSSLVLSIGVNAGAETLLDHALYINPTEENYAILDYDADSDTYELLDKDENPIKIDISGTNSNKHNDTPELPELPESETVSEETNTTLKTSPLPVTAPPPTFDSKAVKTTTVPKRWYVARYRKDVLSSIAANTTVTTRATTTKTTTKTTPKPTTTAKRYKGIDVSRHQGKINWTQVKNAGISFVMIRAGYGKYSDQVDMNFKENIAGAQKAGIDCGVYWYSYALSTADALSEAKVCYNTIKNYKLSYPVAFDIEDSTQMGLTTTQISNIIKTFCEYLESRKYYVCVYSFASMLNSKMNASVKSSYDIWVAHINVAKPNYTGNYGMWQYSHTGKVNGISTVVDLDYSYKYYPSIMKNKKLNGYT